MRKLIGGATLAAILASAAVAYAAVTVRYQNDDDQDYAWPAECHGSHYTAEFSGNTTSSETIQGSSPCVVHTPHGDVSLSGGEHIRIRDGEIHIQ